MSKNATHEMIVRPISNNERQKIDTCNHQYLPADNIYPLAICCVKCGYTLIKYPDGNEKEMFSPAHLIE